MTDESRDALRVKGVTVKFGHGANASVALNNVDLSVPHGRTVGLVGESGSGKSTLAKAILGIVPVASGEIIFDGRTVSSMSAKERVQFRRRVQMIPQDPYSSLNPRRTIGEALAEAIDPVRQNVRKHREAIESALSDVRLPVDSIARYPHEFSGGQRQRIAIARALITNPEIVIADEITSALDVSVQAEVLQLIDRLRVEKNLTMLFISHNLAVVKQVSDDVVVLFRGDVVESAPAEQLFTHAAHSYTRALLAAVPGAPGFSID